ncbi:hypothetical protein RhiJN_28041 [Ceratobasidium sp. AG-Ba]|nr:hypothetical protein RhiJN_28041 [Ceratobasidium sp. AG-Ba]
MEIVNPNAGLFEGMFKYNPLDDERITRFLIYAPFVKAIVNSSNTISTWDWEILTSRVAIRPLFPNLRRLSLDNLFFRMQGSDEEFAFIETLIAPKLLHFRLPGYLSPWVSSYQAGKIISSIACTCLKLKSLSIAVRHSSESPNIGTVLRPIAGLTNLHYLEINHVGLHSETMLILGSLPQLESMVVFSGSRAADDPISTPLNEDDFSLPVSSFPALQHLAITEASPRQINRLWRAPPLVKGLRSVQIVFQARCGAYRLDSLLEGSPHLLELSITTSSNSEWLTVLPTSLTLLGSTGENSLKRLKFRMLMSPPAMMFGTLVCAFTNVVRLDLCPFFVDFDRLALIASRLPLLKYLDANIHFNYWPMTHWQHTSAVTSPSSLYLMCDFVNDLLTNYPTIPGYECRWYPDVSLVASVAR